MLKTAPVFSLLEFTYRDPYVELELPLDLAPEGFIDFVILDTLARRMPRRALMVVEEPEIHKNPLKVMEYVERLVKIVEEKDVTVVMTTHSDLVVLTLAKLVAQRRLRAEDVKVYYFTREAWTRAEEVKIFPDGTVEKLPDWEEATAALF
jgi:AAA15 family ATPase/GTPase